MLTPALIEVRGLVKAYGGLRPLRLESLAVAAGEILTLRGPDAATASVLVDLITGTTLPDAGEITVGGVTTASLADHEAWLAFLEQFGIVNDRVVLLDDLTVRQNLAVPLTLDLDSLPEADARRVEDLAVHVGIERQLLDARLATVSPLTRFLVRLGRGLAHAPGVVLLEHPTLGLASTDVSRCAAAVAAAATPGRAILIVTNDAAFAARMAGRHLDWTAATGRVEAPRRGWRDLFSRS